MKIYHPMFGILEIPEDVNEIKSALEFLKEQEFSHIIQAFIDCLEEALDGFRRNRHAV